MSRRVSFGVQNQRTERVNNDPTSKSSLKNKKICLCDSSSAAHLRLAWSNRLKSSSKWLTETLNLLSLYLHQGSQGTAGLGRGPLVLLTLG